MTGADEHTDGVERQLPFVEDLLRGRTWEQFKFSCDMARQNRDRLRNSWCVVCGRAAVEDHAARFHQAAGVLVGPFCSETCAFLWLKDDRVSDGEYPAEAVRESYRHDREFEHFEDAARCEELLSIDLFPSIEGHDWTGVPCDV